MEQIKRYIYQVYKDKSFSAAAKSLYISQPALSTAISRFEKEIGIKIFDRTKQPISLTTHGALYIESIKEIMAIEDALETRFRELSDMHYGSLTVGGVSFSSYALMSAISAKFYQEFPQIKVTLNLGARGDADFLTRCLRNGEVDLIFTYHNEDEHYKYEPLVQDRIIIAMHKNTPCPDALKKYAISCEELIHGTFDESKKIEDFSLFKDIPFLPYHNSIHEDIMNEMLGEYKTLSYTVRAARHSGMHYNLMAAGVGALVFPSIPVICSPHIDPDIMYFVPKNPAFSHTMYIARTNLTDDNPIVQKYIQASKDVCASLNLLT